MAPSSPASLPSIARASLHWRVFEISEWVSFFQFHHLLADLTAAENVSLPRLITRVRRREATRRATEMLCRVWT